VKLQILPDDGLAGTVAAIKQAKTSLDLTIFRFDRPEIEKALHAAVARGVKVRALVAHTNRGGEKLLRKLEQRLLAGGVTVTRTGDELLRYHGKMLIVDNRTLHVMLFNYTALDARSRSFAIVARNRALVAEAVRLFEADAARQPFSPPARQLVISPDNARTALSAFIRGARKELLIYDPKVSDGSMVRALEDRHALVECFRDDGGHCTLNPRCRLKARLAAARKTEEERLAKEHAPMAQDSMGWSAVSTIFAGAVDSVTSAVSVEHCPPSRWTAAATSASAPSSRPTARIDAPERPKRIAVARPIPLDAPVTMTC